MIQKPEIRNHLPPGKTIFRLSLLVAIYFSLLVINSFYPLDHVLIGVVVEMFTLPMMALGLFLFAASALLIFREGLQPRSYPIFSMVILLTTAITLILTP